MQTFDLSTRILHSISARQERMNEGTRVLLELVKSGIRAGREQGTQDEGATSTLRRIVQLLPLKLTPLLRLQQNPPYGTEFEIEGGK